jgi:hypothetical protein
MAASRRDRERVCVSDPAASKRQFTHMFAHGGAAVCRDERGRAPEPGPYPFRHRGLGVDFPASASVGVGGRGLCPLMPQHGGRIWPMNVRNRDTLTTTRGRILGNRSAGTPHVRDRRTIGNVWFRA